MRLVFPSGKEINRRVFQNLRGVLDEWERPKEIIFTAEDRDYIRDHVNSDYQKQQLLKWFLHDVMNSIGQKPEQAKTTNS